MSEHDWDRKVEEHEEGFANEFRAAWRTYAAAVLTGLLAGQTHPDVASEPAANIAHTMVALEDKAVQELFE